MHALEVIIARNARAAGREAAHAVNDGAPEVPTLVAHGIFNYAQGPLFARPDVLNRAFTAGYGAGRKEG